MLKQALTIDPATAHRTNSAPLASFKGWHESTQSYERRMYRYAVAAEAQARVQARPVSYVPAPVYVPVRQLDYSALRYGR